MQALKAETEDLFVHLQPVAGATNNMRLSFSKNIGLKRQLKLRGYTIGGIDWSESLTHLMLNFENNIHSHAWSVASSVHTIVPQGVPLPVIPTQRPTTSWFPPVHMPLAVVPAQLSEMTISVSSPFNDRGGHVTPIFTELCLWIEAVPIH